MGIKKIYKQVIPILHIIGLPGAGKTTLALRLSRILKVPILRIGYYRSRFPKTSLGEADAWLALFRELSRREWKNCILETTGLNSREAFLTAVFPFGWVFTIKLEASQKTLFKRIRKKKKRDRGGQWLYSAAYRDKYEFVRKLFKCFRKIPADYCINTNRIDKTAVFQRTYNEISRIIF